MKRSTKLTALLLSVLMLFAAMVIGTASAKTAKAEITYAFSRTDKGFAEGTITLTPTSGNFGTYYLYWADDTKALSDYGEIATITVNSGTGKITMPPYTAIPADAEKIIAFNSASAPEKADRTVENSDAVYAIPESKLLPFDTEDALYTFGAISDPQLANDSYGSNSYPYDEEHLAAAFDTLNLRNVDFTVASGDIVNDQNGKQTLAAEYRTYQKILADSSYAKPIYEANGNHDVGTVWNKNGNYYNDNAPFIKATGLDSKAETINKGLPYFEVTEPVTGDHFIFMALEGGFYTNKGTQFSEAQLDWLEGLLKKYKGDGKNIFILEHANVAGWGSGDKLTAPYYYDLGLDKNKADVKRFIGLMETYKDCVIITGHTHLELSAQYNYCDNNGTSAVMIHNSAIGGVRRLINGSVDRTAVLGMSEGYIVEVYEDAILFNGTNMYYNETMPQCCYIIPFGTTSIETPTETEKTSTVPSTAPITVPTTSLTTAPTTPLTTETSTSVITPNPEYKFGDTDLNGSVNVKDATAIQKHAASIITLEGVALAQADVTADNTVNVKDATAIQKLVAGIITSFPAENKSDIAETGALAPHYQRAKEVLESYYTYSSYDQYADLKYEFNVGWIDKPTAEVMDILLDREEKLLTLVEAIGGEAAPEEPGEIDIYFSNNKYWSKVYAYVWGSGGNGPAWPGTAMTKVTTNSQGEDIYKITVDLSKYQNIIFTNNSGEQTEDIVIVEKNNVGYYISGGSSNKYTCKTYEFIY